MTSDRQGAASPKECPQTGGTRIRRVLRDTRPLSTCWICAEVPGLKLPRPTPVQGRKPSISAVTVRLAVINPITGLAPALINGNRPLLVSTGGEGAGVVPQRRDATGALLLQHSQMYHLRGAARILAWKRLSNRAGVWRRASPVPHAPRAP